MWHQFIAADAVTGDYASSGTHEHTDFESYLTTVKKKAAKQAIFK